MTLTELTIEQVRQLRAKGHVVCGYPRKGIIRVDGFKTYTAKPDAIAACKGIVDRVHASPPNPRG